MEKTNMKSVFCAGAGIQSVLFFLNDGYLPAGRELSPRTRIGPFHRPPYCLRQQGPTPADTCFGKLPVLLGKILINFVEMSKKSDTLLDNLTKR